MRAGAGRWLARRWLRRRLPAVLPLALVVAIGTAGTAIALTGAERTADAYGSFLRRSAAGDVVINPAANTSEVEQVIRSLPDVTRISADIGFSATLDDGAPRPRWALTGTSESSWIAVKGSPDGRYVDVDRPVLRAGRMATGPHEMVVTPATAEAEGLAIGDVVPVAFWSVEVNALIGDLLDAYMSEVTEPIGVEQVTVVGIVTLADEILPNDLYPRQRALVSPDLAEKYDCVPPAPPRGSTMREQHEALLPPGCAVRYRYYSLSFAGGARHVKPALDAFVRAVEPMNEALGDVADLPEGEEGPIYNLLAVETDRERRAVERAVRPTVTALYVLAAASAAVTVVLALLAVSRELRRTRPDQRQWHLLGVSPPQRAAVATSPLVLATAGGGIVGLATAWLLGLGPVGLVEVLERGSSRSLSGRAIWSVGGLVAGVVVAAVAIAVRSARRTDDLRSTATRRQGALATLTASTRPVLADGLRAAYSQRSATPVIGGCATLVGAFVAALVFGSSLTGLLAAPASYGWPWDVARVTGFGYGGLDLAGAAALDDDPAVGSWAALGMVNSVALNGEPTLTLVAFDRRSEVDLTLLAGQLPVRPDEVALGATSAADHGLRVGDTVELGGAIPPRQATVTGLVVFPALGAFEAERLGAGVGLLVSESALGDTFGSELIASVAGVDLESGTASSRARVQGLLAPLDMWGFPEVSLARPVRPPEVIGAASTQDVPTAVAGVFAAVTAIGVGFASWASVRSRRRDLAVIQALGGQRRQVRRSIRVQSLATMLASLALGVPAGVIAGRVLWRGFARQLGVVPDAGQPWGPVLLTVVGALGLALLAAVVPGFLASRATPAASLRTE